MAGQLVGLPPPGLVVRVLPGHSPSRYSPPHAVPARSVSATGRRAPARAGMAVSPATAITVPSTAATSHQAGGWLALPPCFATVNRAKPSGRPAMAPASAGRTCAAASPAVSCAAVAPRARVTAAVCRASCTVARVMKTAFTAARATSMIVMINRTRSSRAAFDTKPTSNRSGLAAPVEAAWDAASVAWVNSRATSPLTVTPMLSAPSTTRRGRRAARRAAIRSGTGSRDERSMSHARRRGWRGALARAPTVLVRAARQAGRNVDSAATAAATPATIPTVPTESCGAPAVPRTPAPGRQADRGGHQRHREVLGQEHAGDQFRRAADRLEQAHPPELLGHPPTRQDGQAADGQQGQQPAPHQQDAALLLDQQAVLLADLLPRDQVRVPDVVPVVAARGELIGEGLRPIGAGQLQVQDVTQGRRARGQAAGVGPGQPDH